MVKIVKTFFALIFFILIIFIISILFIREDRNIKIDNAPVSILINKYLDEENYNNIVVYSLNNMNYLSKIFDILNYRLNNLNSTVYAQVDKINILRTIIIINNSLNHKYYNYLEKNIVDLSNRNYRNIDEYISVINLFNNIIKSEELDVDFLELLAQKNLIILNNFIKEYCDNETTVSSFVYDILSETYNNYLNILEKIYNINIDEVNNINDLRDNELKYAILKNELSNYKKSNSKTFLIPLVKTTGKTMLYYQFSKLFNKSALSTGINVVGGIDVGMDALSLYKQVNYLLYKDKIHKNNRLNSIYMNKYDKLYYYVVTFYNNIMKKNINIFENYKVTKDTKDNIDKIKVIGLNKALATIVISNKKNIKEALSKYNEKNFLSFMDSIIIKNKDDKAKKLEGELLEKHNKYINTIEVYRKFLLHTCI